MAKNGKMRVAFDLDGVIASPLFDGLLIKLRILKEHLLKSLGHQKDYFYPQSKWERRVWIFFNRLRKPAISPAALAEFKRIGRVHLILVTSRFKFLERETFDWLKKYGLHDVFDEIYLNTADVDPVQFKTETLNKSDANHFLDDDAEIVAALKNKIAAEIRLLGRGDGGNTDVKSIRSVSDFMKAILAQS